MSPELDVALLAAGGAVGRLRHRPGRLARLLGLLWRIVR